MFETRRLSSKVILQVILTIMVIPYLSPLIAMVQESLSGQGWGNYRAVWAVGGVGDPVVYEAKGDAVRAFSGTTTFFVALFAAIVLSQARARPRWTAVRLVGAVGLLVIVGLVGDLVLGRVFGLVFFAIVNVPVLLTASMLALGGAPRAAT